MKFGLLILAGGFFIAASNKVVFKDFVSKEKISLVSHCLGTFESEKRGNDSYYFNQGTGKFNCSVLFYHLSAKEHSMLVDLPKSLLKAPDKSPIFPLTYFKNYSKLKPYQTSYYVWGDIKDEFMFSSSDIKIVDGEEVMKQKHFNAYSMVDTNIFVKIHISKTNCSILDSLEIMDILSSVRKG